LKPLKWIRTAEPIQNKDGSYSNYIDTHYECGKCRNNNITIDTFSIYYGDKASVYRAKRVPHDKEYQVFNPKTEKIEKAKFNVQINNFEFIGG